MSRNRLSELSNPYTGGDGQAYQSSAGYDLERNELVAGERYEMQDRSGRTLTLNEFLDEVLRFSGDERTNGRLMMPNKRLHGWKLKLPVLISCIPSPLRSRSLRHMEN